MKNVCCCKVSNKQCFINNYADNKALIKFKETGLVFYGSTEGKCIKNGLLINYNDNVVYEGRFNKCAMKDDDHCCLMEFNNGRLFYGKCKDDVLVQGTMLIVDKKSVDKETVVVKEMFEFKRKGKEVGFVDEGQIAKKSGNYYENTAVDGVKKLRRFQKVIKAKGEVERVIRKYDRDSRKEEDEEETSNTEMNKKSHDDIISSHVFVNSDEISITTQEIELP